MRQDDRIPPQALDMEQAVLGAMLIERTAVEKAAAILKPQDFYRDAHRIVFETILTLVRRSEPIDLLTVVAQMREQKQLEEIGGGPYLTQIMDSVPGTANIEYYARQVAEKAVLRQGIAKANEFLALAYKGDTDALAQRNGDFDLSGILKRGKQKPGTAIVTPYNTILPEKVTWLWKDRLPRGKLVLLEGDPEQGKSLLTCEVAARLSRGLPLPGDTERYEPVPVIITSAEDGPGDTIRPRLDAAGADVARVFHLGNMTRPGGYTAPLTLPEDCDLLEQIVQEYHAGLLIIDPLFAYLSRQINSFRDQDVRVVLARLALMCERTGVTVMFVRHLNKLVGGPAIYRGGGSIGIVGAARTALLFAKDPHAPERRILATIKNNLARHAASLNFAVVESENGAPRLDYVGTCDLQAGDLLKGYETREERTATGDAEEFLRATLADGPVPAKKVEQQARQAGIAARTLARARKALGVLSRREGGLGEAGCWCLCLQDAKATKQTAKTANGEYGSLNREMAALMEDDPFGEPEEGEEL